MLVENVYELNEDEGDVGKVPSKVYKTVKYKEGSGHKVRAGVSCTVVKYEGSERVLVRFDDKFGYERWTTVKALNTGQMGNPYYPVVFDIGHFGVGAYVSRLGPASLGYKVTREYTAWVNMLKRVKYTEYQIISPSYIGSDVSDEFKCFQSFAEWFLTRTEEYHAAGIRCNVDKDLLSPLIRGKLYSSETCCVIPCALNTALVFQDTNPIIKVKDYFDVTFIKDGFIFFDASFNTYNEAVNAWVDEKYKVILKHAEKYEEYLAENVKIALENYRTKLYNAFIEKFPDESSIVKFK